MDPVHQQAVKLLLKLNLPSLLPHHHLFLPHCLLVLLLIRYYHLNFLLVLPHCLLTRYCFLNFPKLLKTLILTPIRTLPNYLPPLIALNSHLLSFDFLPIPTLWFKNLKIFLIKFTKQTI